MTTTDDIDQDALLEICAKALKLRIVFDGEGKFSRGRRDGRNWVHATMPGSRFDVRARIDESGCATFGLSDDQGRMVAGMRSGRLERLLGALLRHVDGSIHPVATGWEFPVGAGYVEPPTRLPGFIDGALLCGNPEIAEAVDRVWDDGAEVHLPRRIGPWRPVDTARDLLRLRDRHPVRERARRRAGGGRRGRGHPRPGDGSR